MVWADTSKRRARSSTITRPKARAILRISFWRWVNPATAAPQASDAFYGGAGSGSGERRGTASRTGLRREGESVLSDGRGELTPTLTKRAHGVYRRGYRRAEPRK